MNFKSWNLSFTKVLPRPSFHKLIWLPWHQYMVTEVCQLRFAGKASAKSTFCCAKPSQRLCCSVGCLLTVTALGCCCAYKQASKQGAVAAWSGQALHKSGDRSGNVHTTKSRMSLTQKSHEVSIRAIRMVRTFSAEPIFKSFVTDWLKQHGLFYWCMVLTILAMGSYYMASRTAVHDQGCVVRHPAFLYLSSLFCIPIWICLASLTSWEIFKALLQEFDCLIVLFWGTLQCITYFVNDRLCCQDAYADSVAGLNILHVSGETMVLLFASWPTICVMSVVDAIVIPSKSGELVKTAMYAALWCILLYLNISARYLNSRTWYSAELPTEWFDLSPRAVYIASSTQGCLFVGKLLFKRVWLSRLYVILSTRMVPFSAQEGANNHEDHALAPSRNATENNKRSDSGIDTAEGAKAGWEHDATFILPGQPD